MSIPSLKETSMSRLTSAIAGPEPCLPRRRIGSSGWLLATAVLILAAVDAFAQPFSTDGANAYVAAKNWNGLLSYTQAWTRAQPDAPMAWYYLGETYGQLNQAAAAAQAIEHAVSLQPQWPEAWHALAFTRVQAGQYPQAVDAVRRAISQAPDRPNYWNTLAVAYSDSQDWNGEYQALSDEQQHMSRATSFDWYNLANGFSSLRHHQEAIVAYAHSLQMYAMYPNAWNNLGVEEEALGQGAKALADYQRASQLGDRLGSQNYARLQQASTQQRSGAQSNGHHVACHTTQRWNFNTNSPVEDTICY
jgi:tetratricopeptide (TPR) repeat protein